MSENVIEIKGITKFYQVGTQVVKALRGVDVEIKKGRICCHNGAIGFW